MGVHIDEAVPFLNCDQVKFCFPVGVAAHFAPYLCSGREELFASAGIFYMADFFLAVNLYMGDEPVGPPQKYTGDRILISHRLYLSANSNLSG